MYKPHHIASFASPDRSRKQATFLRRVPVHCITPVCSDALVSPPNLYPPLSALIRPALVLTQVLTPGGQLEHAQHVSSLKIYFLLRLTAVASRILKSLKSLVMQQGAALMNSLLLS